MNTMTLAGVDPRYFVLGQESAHITNRFQKGGTNTVLVLGVIFFAFGDSLGMRGPSNTTVKVEAPKVPVPK